MNHNTELLQESLNQSNLLEVGIKFLGKTIMRKIKLISLYLKYKVGFCCMQISKDNMFVLIYEARLLN